MCKICIYHRDEPHFRFPSHLVHPEHGKRMVFDIYSQAVCPDCGTIWRLTRRNTIEIVES